MKHIKRSELDKYCARSAGLSGAEEDLSKILRAIDTQIEATQALIAKQERVRAGLMQDCSRAAGSTNTASSGRPAKKPRTSTTRQNSAGFPRGGG